MLRRRSSQLRPRPAGTRVRCTAETCYASCSVDVWLLHGCKQAWSNPQLTHAMSGLQNLTAMSMVKDKLKQLFKMTDMGAVSSPGPGGGGLLGGRLQSLGLLRVVDLRGEASRSAVNLAEGLHVDAVLVVDEVPRG